jgi:hypothetical protein
MANLVEECAKLLNCSPKALREHINHPINWVRIENLLMHRKTQTCYLDRKGQHKTVKVNGLTRKAATKLMAYGKMNAKYNVSVCQHFYARHRVRLLFPELPCVIEHFPKGEDRFYPLEMLKFLDEPISNDWLGNMFKEITSGDKKKKEEEADNDKVEEDVDFARSDCSQKMCTCCEPPVLYSCWFTHPH